MSLAYLGIGAVVALYLLPVGFGLEGGVLRAGQIVVIAAGAALVAYSALVVREGVRRRAGVWAVAAAMGWDYVGDISDRLWGDAIDEQIERSSRGSMDYLDASSAEVPFDSVLRTFSVGEGQGASAHVTRAVRIPLAAEAPRIALRTRSGHGTLSALPRVPRGSHGLRLEGNFSDVFDVSVPAGYERDALYVLTPDLMAILLDEVPDLDLELVDRTLHVYFPPLDLSAPGDLGRFLRVIAVLYERFGRRTVRYRDEAAPALDPAVHRRTGDTLSDAARTVRTRIRVGPVVAAVLAPLVPLLIGVVWTWTSG